ncbi:hypothetical protein [Streptomyces sp. NPDC003688]
MIRQAGFYRELHGAGDASAPTPSLRRAVAEARGRDREVDEDRIVAYLRSGTEIFSAMGAERDLITDDEWITGAGSLVTDGTWLWPVELAHYVRRHHVPLPPEFLAHIRSNAHTSPPVAPEHALRIVEAHFARRSAPAPRPYLIWYRPPSPPAPLPALLHAAGLSVTSPHTGRPFGFRRKRQGRPEPLLGTARELGTTLADPGYEETEFYCWQGSTHALTTEVRRVTATAERLTFRIPDVRTTDPDQLLPALLHQLAQNPCLGYVTDPIGFSATEDWDTALLQPDHLLPVHPHTVVHRP